MLVGGGESFGSSVAAGMHLAMKKEFDKGGYSFSPYTKIGFPVWDEKKSKHVIVFLFDGPETNWAEFKNYVKAMKGRSWLGRQASKTYQWLVDFEVIE